MTPKKVRKSALRKPAAKAARRARAIPVKKARAAAGPAPRGEGLPLLRRLSEACGVSGDETAVREIIREALKGKIKTSKVDALGNLLVTCRTRGKPRMRVMVAAHMDEVGMVLMQAGSDGLWKFETVGGVNEQALPGKPVWIGKNRTPGVIGVKPVHLTEKDECEHPIKKDALTIDIGAKDKEGATAALKAGDRAAFATAFHAERGVILGKALDDRLGVAALIELALDPPPGIELVAAFTTQEEIGLRGAQVAAYALNPKAAFVLDTTPAADMPMWDGGENTAYNTKLGGGPAIYIFDRGTISDARLVRLLRDAAGKRGVPYQIRQPGSGGTDAGAIHLARAGIPSVSVSIPCRSLHGPVSTARLSDWRAVIALVRGALEDLGRRGLP
ncbi:MAG: M20/M25/M40 family metallo-hydrolase [Anaerolineales bacterium]|nr:M20/M25/M40 family metallo-hydrolase [Anaerolineales bacterium]